MSFRIQIVCRVLAVCVLATLSLAAIAEAQPTGRGRGDSDGRGYMMGPGMMDRHHLGRMCSPRAAGFAEWRLDRLERVLKPTDAQRVKFDELKAASTKAAEAMRAACPTDVPTTMVGRMEASEKRLDAMLQAIKTMRPALEGFYATLTDEQKAQIDSSTGRRGRFWHWRDRW
jgi:cytosine/adenosine deaminase-related metal-dependent hydrolase